MESRPGFVYLIQDSDVTGFVKIGRTNNPRRRVMEFSVKLPFSIKVILLLKCNEPRKLESHLHFFFNDRRVNGEWFNLTALDIAYIKAMAAYVEFLGGSNGR